MFGPHVVSRCEVPGKGGPPTAADIVARMKILFIGGTGNISSTVTRMLSEAGHEVHLLNRAKTLKHPLPKGAKKLLLPPLEATGLGAIPIRLRAGNFGVIGVKG